MKGWLVNLGAKWFGVSDVAKKAEDYKASAAGVATVLGGLAGIAGSLAGLIQELLKCNTVVDYLNFAHSLSHDPLLAALLAAYLAVTTGLHQIAVANHHADLAQPENPDAQK